MHLDTPNLLRLHFDNYSGVCNDLTLCHNSNLRNITELSLRSGPWINLKPLHYFSCLTKLDLSFCLQVVKLEGFRSISTLEKLVMANCLCLQDIQDLHYMPHSSSLNFNQCHKLQNVATLSSLPSLRKVWMVDTDVSRHSIIFLPALMPHVKFHFG